LSETIDMWILRTRQNHTAIRLSLMRDRNPSFQKLTGDALKIIVAKPRSAVDVSYRSVKSRYLFWLHGNCNYQSYFSSMTAYCKSSKIYEEFILVATARDDHHRARPRFASTPQRTSWRTAQHKRVHMLNAESSSRHVNYCFDKTRHLLNFSFSEMPDKC